jgi:hypothetical protein
MASLKRPPFLSSQVRHLLVLLGINFLMEWGQFHTQLQTWMTRSSLFVWVITCNLSSIRCPACSHSTAVTALRILISLIKKLWAHCGSTELQPVQPLSSYKTTGWSLCVYWVAISMSTLRHKNSGHQEMQLTFKCLLEVNFYYVPVPLTPFTCKWHTSTQTVTTLFSQRWVTCEVYPPSGPPVKPSPIHSILLQRTVVVEDNNIAMAPIVVKKYYISSCSA